MVYEHVYLKWTIQEICLKLSLSLQIQVRTIYNFNIVSYLSVIEHLDFTRQEKSTTTRNVQDVLDVMECSVKDRKCFYRVRELTTDVILYYFFSQKFF